LNPYQLMLKCIVVDTNVKDSPYRQADGESE